MSTAVPDVTPLIAPILIGHSFNWLGFGSLLVQCYIYYTNFPTDRTIIRVLVYTVLFLEIVHMVTTSHQTYWYTVTNWGKFAELQNFPWSSMTVPFVDSLVAAVVQTFYAWRVWTLGRTKTMKAIACLIMFTALGSAGVAMVSAAYFAAHSSRELLLQLQPAFSAWLATGLAADILVAGAMLYILYTAKANTMWPTSENFLTRLITSTIGTGFAVAVCGLLTLVLFLTSPPNSLQYLSAAYLLGKLYSNTLMVTLNARRNYSNGASTGLVSSSQGQADSLPLRIRVARQIHTRDDMHDGELVHRTVNETSSAENAKQVPFYNIAYDSSGKGMEARADMV